MGGVAADVARAAGLEKKPPGAANPKVLLAKGVDESDIGNREFGKMVSICYRCAIIHFFNRTMKYFTH
jgi:hypothetical protein